VDKLALKLLEGEFAPGDVVEVDAADGELTFAKASDVLTRTGEGDRPEGSPSRRGVQRQALPLKAG
jgi:hypothetical protein